MNAPTVPLYSLAKPLTAAAILLSEIAPDAPVGHLAPVPHPLADLTVVELLRHRSGLGDYAAWPEYRDAVAARARAWPADEVLTRASREERGTPGRFRYSNVGYLLLRRVLEEHHGATFFEVVTSTVLTPLGIPAHPFDAPAHWAAVTPAPAAEITSYDPAWVYPGTVVVAVDDIARTVAGLVSGALGPRVSPMAAGLPVDAPGHPLRHPGYGLGLMTAGDPATLVGHGGAGPGFTLAALATADGSSAHACAVAAEVPDAELFAACLDALGDVSGREAAPTRGT